jgi:predicted ArsR family transcriptional regulator
MISPREALARMSGKKSAPAYKALKYPDRSEDENTVLRLLAKNPRLTTEEIAFEIKASADVARLHLNNLFKAEFVQWYNEHQLVDPSAPRAKKGTLWRLQDHGVAYLLERGWHK